MWNKVIQAALITSIIGGQLPGQDQPAAPSKQTSPSPQESSEKNPPQQTPGTEQPAAGGIKLGVATESEKLLDEAMTKVSGYKSIRADLRQKVEMLGYSFTAEGRYALGPDLRLLYELKVQLTSDTTGTLKEVCDGRTHWRNQKVLDTQELVKVDIKKLSDVFDKPQFDKDLREQLVQQLGFSGMVPMMKGLRDAQKFDSHTEEMLDDKPVYVLHGQWREEAISRSSFRGQQLSLAKLPPYIPSKCTVWIGRDDGWLHKVEMEATKKAQGTKSRVTLEFLNPQLGVDLPDSLFAFEPPEGVRAEDQTEAMYQRLNLILQQSQNRSSPGSGASSAPASGSGALQPRSASPAGTSPSQTDGAKQP